MVVSCPDCGKQFKLRDDRLPEIEAFRITCPNCSGEIVVRKEGQGAAARPQQPEQGLPLEPEVFPAGARVAFVFMDDERSLEALKYAVEESGLTLSGAESVSEAVAKARMNRYDLMCLEENESGRVVMEVVNSWPGGRRREVNVIMVGNGAQSLDPGISFLKGVNGWLNPGDTDRFRQLVGQLEDDFALYRASWDVKTES